MRHLIKFRTFLKEAGFIASLCDVLKVLHLAKFSEIWHRYTKQDKVSDHQLKITFRHCYKRQPPLPCESINFINFLFILHHKYQNNLTEPKTS